MLLILKKTIATDNTGRNGVSIRIEQHMLPSLPFELEEIAREIQVTYLCFLEVYLDRKKP